METYKGRLESFSQVKRVKNPSLSSSASIRWTHPASFAATPKTLAEAGFYFDPSWTERDNVQCFNCGKELAGWANDDDPFELHWTKCRSSCVWASVRCGLRYDVDEDGLYVFNDKKRLPTSKTMEKARLGTFTHWPHDATKGHGASSKKMAQAGFVFTPQVADEDDDDDTAACFYCGCTLSGWEPDDDPTKEHEKRAFKTDTPCAFFAKSASSSTKPPSSSLPEPKSKPKPKPKPKPKQSVRPSRSTKIPDSDVADESEDELELPPIRKGRSASASKTKSTPEPTAEPSKRRVTRGGSRAGSVAEEDSSGTKARTTKAKGKGKKKEDVIEELEEDDVVVESTKPKKSKPKKDPVMDPHLAEDTTEEIKPTKANANAKARTDAKVTAPDSDPATDVPTISSKPISRAAEPKQKLVRSKSQSKSKARPLIVESSESEAHVPEAKLIATKPKAAPNKVPPKEASPHPPANYAQSKPEITTVTEEDHPTFGKLQQAQAGDSHTEKFQERLSVATVEQGNEESTTHKQVMKVVEISTDDEEGPDVPAEPALALEHSESTPVPADVDKETKHDAMDETADGEPLHGVQSPSTPPPPPLSPVRSPQPPDAGTSRFTSPQPQAFLPPLAILPISHIVAFTEPEQNMTVEEWIRHEIALQYSQLKGDGERRIEAFRLRADAMRKRIETL
ncbi:hypothetical protein FIBSPDRAFT_1039808 [Athelia psychrophila]|uniref:BIR-domain-containing protein n=1 Tax=Athelia psychrophila TaxID=1759441 RepID=A0A166RC84_9AGAM|nr:hypothetical protein FIBSPDRAFT_1039808 [Fibularhizoctonia sp. CBS 109695]